MSKNVQDMFFEDMGGKGLLLYVNSVKPFVRSVVNAFKLYPQTKEYEKHHLKMLST